MARKQYWLWVDGQKRYYDYPPEPPGYTLDQALIIQWLREYFEKRRREELDGQSI